MNGTELLYWTLVLLICVEVIFVVCFCIYDIMLAKWRHRDDRQPDIDLTVTVLVLVDEDGSTLESCLRSIQNSNYVNHDIVIIDSTFSKIESRAIVTTVKNMQLEGSYIYKPRTRKSTQQLWREAYKRSQRADYVLTMTSEMRLLPDTLREAVRNITLSPQIKYVELPFMCNNPISLEICATHLKHASQSLTRTVRSIFLKANVSRLHTGGLYDSALLNTQNGKKYVEYRYGIRAPLVVKSHAYRRYTRKQNSAVVTGVFYVAFVSLFVSCLWLAAATNNDRPLVIFWVGFMVWAGIAILLTETLNARLKFHVIMSLFVLPYVFAVNQLVRLGLTIKLKAK